LGTLGLEVRAGLHTGECELVGGKIAGLAVNIGARIAALAAPNEVLVSSTVKDLVVGSDLGFEDRGTATLKGVPGEWHLFALR
jgi:class 3 adenylate cyclase